MERWCRYLHQRSTQAGMYKSSRTDSEKYQRTTFHFSVNATFSIGFHNGLWQSSTIQMVTRVNGSHSIIKSQLSYWANSLESRSFKFWSASDAHLKRVWSASEGQSPARSGKRRMQCTIVSVRRRILKVFFFTIMTAKNCILLVVKWDLESHASAQGPFQKSTIAYNSKGNKS